MINIFFRPLWVRFLLWVKLIRSDDWYYDRSRECFWLMLPETITDPNLAHCTMDEDVSILEILASVDCANEDQLETLDDLYYHWQEEQDYYYSEYRYEMGYD
jgi:hypothetical protein